MSKIVQIDLPDETIEKLKCIMHNRNIPDCYMNEVIAEMINESSNKNILAWDWKPGEDPQRHKFHVEAVQPWDDDYPQ